MRPQSGSRRAFAAAAAALGVGVALIIAEVALRITDFSPGRVNSGYLQFGYQSGIPSFDEDGVRTEGHPVRVRLFEPDPEVLWHPIPNTEFTNSRGFRGRVEYSELKGPNTIRILFVGDSCSFLGDPVYPELVQRELADHFPGKTVECINSSSPGYTSFQGTKLLPRLQAWHPDAVVIYFGWNDHWPGQGGLTDTMQYSMGRGLRLAGLLQAVRAQQRSQLINRVPLAQFEANLQLMRDTVVNWHAVPVFITAPTGFRSGAMPAWTYRFFGQFYHMDKRAVDAVPQQHQAYATAVRTVAAHPPSVLVDAEQDFRNAELAAAQIFRSDQIHLRTPGHERMAHLVATAVAAALEHR